LHRSLRSRIPELFEKMKQKGLTTSLDTNDDPADRWSEDLLDVLKHVDVFFANEREAQKIVRADNLEEAIAALSPRVPRLVVKLGAEGALACGPSGQVRRPALDVEVVDPVGAGDSFDAGFIHQYVRGAALANCVAYGNTAGAFSTTRPGGTEAFRERRHFEDFFRRR
jgi:sugar/nucleoside kinase (ribokinase family)